MERALGIRDPRTPAQVKKITLSLDEINRARRAARTAAIARELELAVKNGFTWICIACLGLVVALLMEGFVG